MSAKEQKFRSETDQCMVGTQMLSQEKWNMLGTHQYTWEQVVEEHQQTLKERCCLLLVVCELEGELEYIHAQILQPCGCGRFWEEECNSRGNQEVQCKSMQSTPLRAWGQPTLFAYQT